MRILFLFLLLPLFSFAQPNRSATALAQERIRDYVINKLGIAGPADQGQYSELKPITLRKTDAEWRMDYLLTVRKAEESGVESTEYKMSFYFDRRMKILRANSSQKMN